MVDAYSAQMNLIAGRWQPAEEERKIPVECPSNGERFSSIAQSTESDIDHAVAAARQSFERGSWRRLTATERGRLLICLAEKVDHHFETLAHLEAQDTGKPLTQARADITATARYFEFYGGAADKLHGEVIPYLNGFHVQSLREPLGVTAHIIPWNYPAQMFGRTLAPSLAMGNAVVLKPAEEASMTPLYLAKLAMEVGFPEGTINVVTGHGDVAGAALSKHPDIDFISFTGSPEVGSEVQAAAAKNHVDCTLELGGKSPQIVFEDADLDSALAAIVRAVIQNGGQTCSAGSRALVQKSIFDDVIKILGESFSNLMAAPHDEDRDLGSLITAAQKNRVEKYLQSTDAEKVAEGQISDLAPTSGHYVAPMLYGPVRRDDPLAREEIFGPVLSCLPFDDETDAIELANNTEFGLVSGVWTLNGSRQVRMAKALRCGQVFINCYGAGGGIELPFGGVGKSGHGREKGFEALREFTTLKTIVQKHD